MQLSYSLTGGAETYMVMTRLAILYTHMLSCCIAVGVTLTADATAMFRIVRGQTSERRLADFQTLQMTVLIALLGLWITGTGIIAIDVFLKGWGEFANPKLQAKIFVVLVLTTNGVVLHRYAMPALIKAGSLLNLPPAVQKRVLGAGVLSGVSWMYATFLGLARPLAWKYSLPELLTAYPLIVLLAWTTMSWLINISLHKVTRSDVNAAVS